MLLLRLLAIVIAAAGFVDPALSVSRPMQQPLTIAILETPSMALPDGNDTRRGRAYRSAEQLRAELHEHYDIAVRAQDANSAADPCPIEGACVVISNGARPRVLEPRDRIIDAVRVPSALAPNVAIRMLDAPSTSDLSALSAIDVQLEGSGVGGSTTTVEVFDGEVMVGTASHRWASMNAGDTSTVIVRAEWAPLATGVRDVRVVATAATGEATALDNIAQTAVNVVRRAANVLVYEPQPSWSSAFVRRAIESDPRFHVITRTRLGPAHTVSSRPVALTAEALQRENVAVVVVGAPHLLARTEIIALERFARLRGGSVVMLLDAPPSGEIANLLASGGVERREAAPVSLGELKASELVVFGNPGIPTTVLAWAGKEPVIVSRALGHGRVIASGALDAWRFRAEGDHFDRYWRSLVAEAADAAGESLMLTLSHSAAAPGEHVELEVEWRSLHDISEPLEAAARLQCGSRMTPIRLWPTGSRGRFRGGFEAPSAGHCEVTATITPLAAAIVPLRVVEGLAAAISDRDELSGAIAAHGGIVVDAGNEAALITRLRSRASPQRVSATLHPLRSPWWIVPFTACLGAEWWLRRRQGLL
jgi:hypothetical protein